MEIVLGKMAGFCGGVRNAVNKTYKEAESNNKTIYCLGDLVHNPVVLSENNKQPRRSTKFKGKNCNNSCTWCNKRNI